MTSSHQTVPIVLSSVPVIEDRFSFLLTRDHFAPLFSVANLTTVPVQYSSAHLEGQNWPLRDGFFETNVKIFPRELWSALSIWPATVAPASSSPHNPIESSVQLNSDSRASLASGGFTGTISPFSSGTRITFEDLCENIEDEVFEELRTSEPLPPLDYTCHRCGKPGHIIQYCPEKNLDPLTPYQGDHPSRGEFKCHHCGREWSSSDCKKNVQQECLVCKKKVFPHKMLPMAHSSLPAGKPRHRGRRN